MLKVTYVNKLDASKQESEFNSQAELDQHQIDHPELYDSSMFDVTTKDITAQDLAQKEVDKYLKRIQYGQVLMAELAAMNKTKLASGAYTQDQVLGLKQALAPVKDFITEGSLGFAYQAIESAQGLPNDLVIYFKTKISEYLNKETQSGAE